jgi:ketosteroid isomerase-like protein
MDGRESTCPVIRLYVQVEQFRFRKASRAHPVLQDDGPSANDVQRMNGLPEDAVREIEQIHSRWIELEVAGQHHGLIALFADDIELWPPDAPPLLGRAAVSAWMVRGTTKIHRIDITERRVRGSNEIAYLTANYKTTFSLREDSITRQSRGSHLWILRKQAGTWAVTLASWSVW